MVQDVTNPLRVVEPQVGIILLFRSTKLHNNGFKKASDKNMKDECLTFARNTVVGAGLRYSPQLAL